MEKLKIRPYARLLSMLGDQLIKNETIALTELVKNSYDADATICNVKFMDFKEEPLESNVSSSIIIEDNGDGMSYDTITKHFLNPATPVKKINTNNSQKTRSGRIKQGEKGIGRFAMLKLGKVVTVLSKEFNSDVVHKIVFDFSSYDDEFLTIFSNNKTTEKEIFLDEINVDYEEKSLLDYDDEFFVSNKNKGTKIIITDLKGNWTSNKVSDFEAGMLRFSPFELEDSKVVTNTDFNVDVYINNKFKDFKSDEIQKLTDIVFHKSIFKISGNYNEQNKYIKFSYTVAGEEGTETLIYLDPTNDSNRPSQDFHGLTIYKEDKKNKTRISDFYRNNSTTECGSFAFNFYIFDFSANKHDSFGLSNDEKDVIRNHRIFLYRDDIRVQPYGATNDDWLEIDRDRANTKANQAFSNDQLFGQIKITKSGNEKLKDKTSREGIIEDIDAFNQLKMIVKGFLTYIRTKLYQNYMFMKEKQLEKKRMSEDKISSEFDELRVLLKEDKQTIAKLESIQSAVMYRDKIYDKRIDIAEQLAGVGLSVEVASHDIMLMFERLRDSIHLAKVESGSPLTADIQSIDANLTQAEGLMGNIYMKMKDIQQLFVSSKQRPKLILVEDVIKKIQSIYAKAFNDKRIKVEYEKIGSPVKVKLIDAVLYQVFINLFDNALYWSQETVSNRLVKITLDGANQSVIFSDNGIGVRIEDVPYIFDAFYSGKGEEGRGLGLYIARKLLEKSGYDIDIITEDSKKILKGANFIVSFVTNREDNL